jgi:UDP-N-acetylmuramyl pentapeptide phosphotransferase/UDP-N-acetylglucosamine-1-phosphate transferase
MMLTIINAYNLIDGIDGLASTVAIIIFSIYAMIFFATDLHFYFLLCLSLIGILLAYLYYNFSSTKKIFMGDTGSLIIGFCIGVCTLKFLAMDAALFSHFSFQPENKLIVIAAILWVPLFDMFRVIGVRLLNKKSPFYPDRNHMHHILIDTGLSHFKATMLLGFLNYLLVIVIIWLSSLCNSVIMMAVLMGLFVSGLLIFAHLKKKIILKNKKIKSLKVNIN